MADQHNPNIPALGNSIADDVVDIKENLEFHKDCFEQICTGWANDSVAELRTMDGGTIMLFGQSSAPTGWTRKTDWTDTSMICYAATGDIGSGGAVNPQSVHSHGAGTFVIPNHQHILEDAGTITTSDGESGGVYSSTKGGLAKSSYSGAGSGTIYYFNTQTETDGGTGAVTGTSTENSVPYYQEVIAAIKD